MVGFLFEKMEKGNHYYLDISPSVDSDIAYDMRDFVKRIARELPYVFVEVSAFVEAEEPKCLITYADMDEELDWGGEIEVWFEYNKRIEIYGYEMRDSVTRIRRKGEEAGTGDLGKDMIYVIKKSREKYDKEKSR